jgi:hypothetical protein
VPVGARWFRIALISRCVILNLILRRRSP